MAPSDDIIAKAKDKKFNAARNIFDAELAKIAKQVRDEKEQQKQRKEFIDSLTKDLKAAGSSIIYILKGEPVTTLDVVYDSFGETMEPMYYWLLDSMKDMGYDVEKPADFFAASEASGYYGEMGIRRTNLEKRAMELLGTANAVIKSVLNLMWDLKSFDIRLQHYADLNSKDNDIKRSGMEALKGIWLNEVDKAKGNASIDVLSTSLNFINLREAFMAVPVYQMYVPSADRKKIEGIKEKAIKNVEAMDISDIVRRILRPRIKEFIEWLYLSEKELKNRRTVEKSYLKAQINALKVYTNWTRPYLIATQKLIPAEYRELMSEHKELGLGPAAIPTPFHAMWFYLELWGAKKATITELRPPYYSKPLELKNDDLRPNSALEIRLAFRGSPAIGTTGVRGERGYGFTGKTYIRFSSYVLNSNHAKLLREKRDSEVLQFIDIMTTETLETLSEEIKGYLEEKPETATEEKKKFEMPFPKFVKDAFGSMKKFNDEAKKLYAKMPKIGAGEDAWKVARLFLVAREKAKKDGGSIVVNFKKSHQMLTAK